MILALLLGCGSVQGPGATPDGDEPDDASDGDPLPHADALVAQVRAEGEAAMLAIAAEHGWPVPTAEGQLVIHRARGAWQVAGAFDDWAGQPMRCDTLCWALLDATEGGYKFTDGSTWLADPLSRRYTYDEHGEMSLIGSRDAHLQRWFAVGDAQLAPRTVRAWVPAGPITHVLYAHDGQNLFDPEAPWGGWRLQHSAPEGLLVVGIDNTAARMDEYTHVPDTLAGVEYGGDGDAYAAFVRDTVRPLIRAHHGEPGPVGVLGSSLGGLISLHMAQADPGEYRFAASLSGTLGWGSFEQHNPTVIERFQGAGHQATALYLDSGGGGVTCADSDGDGIHDDDLESDDNYCETLQLRDVLAAEGYRFDHDLWHWWEPDAAHDEAAWAARVGRPLELFVGLE